MRFVAVKSAKQQSVLMLHRSRALMVLQRTMLVNAIGAHLAEFGIVAAVGLPQVKAFLAVIGDEDDERIPPLARHARRILRKPARPRLCRRPRFRPRGPLVAWRREALPANFRLGGGKQMAL